EQVAEGRDWAAMSMLQVVYRAGELFAFAISSVVRPSRQRLGTAFLSGLLALSPINLGNKRFEIVVPGAYQPGPRPDFRTLQGAADFIQRQRQLNGKGLPLTFRVPPNVRIAADATATKIAREGVGLYDTAIGVIALTEAGRTAAARE